MQDVHYITQWRKTIRGKQISNIVHHIYHM